MKAALIGAGQIARQHLACLSELSVDVVGICDLSPATAESTAERHHVRTWFTDHRLMLERTRPDVVHITTPPTSHYRLACDAIEAGAHVIVEKPATATLAEIRDLLERATSGGRVIVEDYNYLFNPGPRAIERRIASGEFGRVVHVEVLIALDILGPGGFADPNAPHPALTLGGGAIADFLPHLASLAHRFVGRHASVSTVWSKRTPSVLPYDEFRAMIDAERGTASLAFSANSRPDSFWLRVHGERMRATASLWDRRVSFERVRSGSKPLASFVNGLDEGRAVSGAAVGTLVEKFRGGLGAYAGLWELLRRTYAALATGAPIPITAEDVLDVNRLVAELKPTAAAR